MVLKPEVLKPDLSLLCSFSVFCFVLLFSLVVFISTYFLIEEEWLNIDRIYSIER